jgi:hypothetical protein
MNSPIVARAAAIAFLALGMQTSLAAPMPVGEWLFNETGTIANSTGSNTALDLTLRNQTGAVADMHSADGTGVTGLAGDRAFDNRGATDMGTGYSSRADIADSASNVLDSLTNFTLAGWFRRDPQATSDSAGWLFNNYYYGPGVGFTGYGLFYADGQLGVISGHYNGYDLAQSTAGAYADADSWVFFAAVHEGSGSCPLNCPSVSFYKGTLSGGVTLVNTVSGAGVFQGGTPYPDAQYFTIGSTSFFVGQNGVRTSQPFDGLMDDMRIYNTTLTLADLEGVRSQAVVPVPGAVWLFASAIAALASLRRR